MKKKSEIITLIKKEFKATRTEFKTENLAEGLCIIAARIRNKGIITEGEEKRFDDYMYKAKDVEFPVGGYKWNLSFRFGYKPRLDWMNKHIKIQQKLEKDEKTS